MTLALFGGTFNPVHLGHLLMAEAACERFRLKHVTFLPTAQPPHKKNPMTRASHRVAMLRLAIRGNRRFKVSDWEIRQDRVVYTYEALEHFRRQWPREKLAFIIGSDSLQQLPTWRQGMSLLDQCDFLVVERPEAPWKQIPASLRRRVRQVPSVPVPFASHAIRAQVRKGQSIRYQVPDSVERYIQRHRLYQDAD